MDKLYSAKKNELKTLKAKPETISFLMAYSKSLSITKVNGFKFETNLN